MTLLLSVNYSLEYLGILAAISKRHVGRNRSKTVFLHSDGEF